MLVTFGRDEGDGVGTWKIEDDVTITWECRIEFIMITWENYESRKKTMMIMTREKEEERKRKNKHSIVISYI